MSCPVAHAANRKHHRHLYQYAHDRCERCAGTWAKQSNRRGHRQFEEVARTDQRAGGSHRVLHPEEPHQAVRQAGIEIDLNQDRHGQQCDDERLPEDLLALESEEQHQCGEQRGERRQVQTPERTFENLRPTMSEQSSAPELGSDHRKDDV